MSAALLYLFISFMITWGMGLGIPLILRYFIFKKTVSKKTALWISIGWLVVQLLIWGILGSPSKSHFALYIISVITYRILLGSGEITKDNASESKLKKRISKELSSIRNPSKKVN